MAQTGHANGGDWREGVYQRIQSLKDLYFADMNEMSQKIALKLQQHDSLEQPKTEQLEKLRFFKAMLDKSMAFLQLNKNSIAIHHKDKLPWYEKQIVSFVSSNRPRRPASSLQQGQLVLTDNNNWRPIQSGEPIMDTMSLDSMAQTGHANGDDWREEVYQRIQSLKDLYFADMNETSQKIALKLQQHDSLEQPKTEQLEKLRFFKAMLDKSMAFLQLNKNSIAIHHKDKLPWYEKQIVSFVSSNRPRRPASSLQQGQLVLTDNNNWRPIQSGEPTMDTSDWRTQLQPALRQQIINKIMDMLKKNLPYSGQEGLHQLEKIAVRFEEKIYNAAISQSDYLRKISLKMISVVTMRPNTMADSLPSNTVGTSSKTPVPGNVFKPSLRVRRKKNALKRVKKSRDPKGSML